MYNTCHADQIMRTIINEIFNDLVLRSLWASSSKDNLYDLIEIIC